MNNSNSKFGIEVAGSLIGVYSSEKFRDLVIQSLREEGIPAKKIKFTKDTDTKKRPMSSMKI